MPIYELVCHSCNNVEEIRCSYEEYITCLHECPKCEEHMNRVISAGGFRLHGDGFYKPTIDIDK